VCVSDPEDDLEERKNHSWPKTTNTVKAAMEQIP